MMIVLYMNTVFMVHLLWNLQQTSFLVFILVTQKNPRTYFRFWYLTVRIFTYRLCPMVVQFILSGCIYFLLLLLTLGEEFKHCPAKLQSLCCWVHENKDARTLLTLTAITVNSVIAMVDIVSLTYSKIGAKILFSVFVLVSLLLGNLILEIKFIKQLLGENTREQCNTTLFIKHLKKHHQFGQSAVYG